jgi:hypothetical protein
MFDSNGSVEIFRQFACNLIYKPVLDECGLNSQPRQYDQADQHQQNGPGYFPKLSQGWSVLVVKVIKPTCLLRKINTNDLLSINFSEALTQ